MSGGRRYRAQRQRRQMVKRRPDRVLMFEQHRPWGSYVAFDYGKEGMVRVEEGPDDLLFHSMSRPIGGYYELAPDKWPDAVCAWMARCALVTEGEKT